MNRGNTCFMNATLQCLVHLPPLANYLLSGRHSVCCNFTNKGRCILCNLGELTGSSVAGDKGVISPEWFVQNLNKIGENLRHGRQEDGHEFLLSCLDKMRLASSYSHSPKTCPPQELDELFTGQLRSQVKCLNCSSESNSFDKMADISVDISRATSLHQALANFVAKDRLDGYRCQKCHQTVEADKDLRLHETPDVVIIQLKRFTFFDPAKIVKFIEYPEKLNLRPYMSSTGPKENFNLFATINHEGLSTDSGHYTANVHAGELGWFHYNDSLRSQITEKEALSQSSAYVLMYVRSQRPSDDLAQRVPNVQRPHNSSVRQLSPKNNVQRPHTSSVKQPSPMTNVPHPQTDSVRHPQSSVPSPVPNVPGPQTDSVRHPQASVSPPKSASSTSGAATTERFRNLNPATIRLLLASGVKVPPAGPPAPTANGPTRGKRPMKRCREDEVDEELPPTKKAHNGLSSNMASPYARPPQPTALYAQPTALDARPPQPASLDAQPTALGARPPQPTALDARPPQPAALDAQPATLKSRISLAVPQQATSPPEAQCIQPSSPKKRKRDADDEEDTCKLLKKRRLYTIKGHCYAGPTLQ